MSATRSPRLCNDSDKYIRFIKGGRYQARPYCEEEHRRYNVGTFATKHQARKAIEEFWWGKREGLPRFTRLVYTAVGVRYRVLIRLDGRTHRVGGAFETREAAAAAVREFLLAEVGPERAAALIEGREKPGGGRRPKKKATAGWAVAGEGWLACGPA